MLRPAENIAESVLVCLADRARGVWITQFINLPKSTIVKYLIWVVAT